VVEVVSPSLQTQHNGDPDQCFFESGLNLHPSETVVYKAITGNAPFSSATSVKQIHIGPVFPIVQSMILCFNSFVYAFVDALSNGMGNNSPGFLNYVSGVLLAISLRMYTSRSTNRARVADQHPEEVPYHHTGPKL